MENKRQKCSYAEHKEFDAISYCLKCEIYNCNKCEKYHLGFFPHHKTLSLDKDISKVFTGFCKYENHQVELDYFCKNHNELCCAKCIALKSKGNGQHNGCNVCDIEDIVEEKKANLKNNIKILEDLLNSLKTSIDELKKIVEKIVKNKEEIKLDIQKIFTKIRNSINNREDELLLEVDTLFEKNYCNENILKETEKLPNKIKKSLEQGKLIEKEWDNNDKLNSLINGCIDIEKNITHINKINDKIKECNSNNTEIKFNSDDGISLLELIKQFGSIKNKEENNNIQNNINISIIDFNPQKISCVKKISDSCGYGGNSNVYDSICFFISKNNEYVLSFIDSNSNNQTVIFYDINNDKEMKRINNAHEKYIYVIKYYAYHIYDVILTCSYNNDMKLWNYNECINLITIKNIFDKESYVFSSALLFDHNSFYIVCIGNYDYIKIYNSSGNFYKNIGNKDEYRRYVEIFEINDNKYIISGSNNGVTVFNYPSFSQYYCFKEDNDTNYHNYAKIVKIKNIYNLIDVGNFNKIKIWDFFNKNLIKCITSNASKMLGGFILINNIYLIIGSFDKKIKVFDINNGIIIKEFDKHTSNVLGIKAIKDKDNNQFFISYGPDKNIYLWKYD